MGMSMFNNNIGLAIGKSLANDQKQKLGYRGDMYFADALPLNRSEAKVMIGYDRSLGRPSLNQVSSFVLAKFDGEVDPKLASVQYHEKGFQHAVTVAGVLMSKRLPAEESKQMEALSSTMFLDTTLGETWEIKADNGHDYLECVRDEDIGSILKAARGKHVVSASCSFASVATGSVEFNVGDTVEFIGNGILRVGVVKSKTDSKVTISSDDQSLIVDAESVIKVVELSPKSAEEQRKVVFDYFKQVYGPEHAREFVKEMK